MRRIVLLLISTILLITPTNALAIVDPLSAPNNKFGIHIISEVDIPEADNLVNSSGGDWGYVTIVIRADERDSGRWQGVFDDLRSRHLIPLIRIASKQSSNGWEKLDEEDIDNWMNFFNSLNWVVQNRYVIVGNEVNHASEWGGDIDPYEYAKYLRLFYETLKASSEDYFILPAGLDASAPNARNHMSEDNYLWQMLQADPDIFNYIDGWNSHSYPNPEFSGSFQDKGRGTVSTYNWEMDYLKQLGFDRNLPIFVTETGWKHDVDSSVLGYKSEFEISSQIEGAYKDAWSDPRIVAVTPFLLRYNGELFEQFSWKKPNGEFYDFYNKVKSISKTSGSPVQVVSGEIELVIVPLLAQHSGSGLARIRNTGQSIWMSGQMGVVNIDSENILVKPMKYLGDIEPDEVGFVFFRHNNNAPCDFMDCGQDVGMNFPSNNLAQFRGIASVILSSEYEAGGLN